MQRNQDLAARLNCLPISYNHPTADCKPSSAKLNSPDDSGSDKADCLTEIVDNSKRLTQPRSFFKLKAYSLQLIAFLFFSSVSLAQTPASTGAAAGVRQEIVRDINGIVRDAVTNKPLVGAWLNIYVDSVKYVGTMAKEDGSFDFRGTHISRGVLKVSHPGYIPQEIQLSTDNNGPYSIALRPESIGIEEVEVVSTGYFAVPKERATGSFTHVDQKLLSRSVGSNVIDRLRDVVPGLTFNQTNMGRSTLRNQPSISLRGRSTINANAEPLIVLDNFPYEGDLADINPEDIESVTILQDAAAASIWGARAGNGVIVLTSKKGGLERPLQVSVRSDYSISDRPDMHYAPTISMADFIEVERFLFGRGAWNAYINQGFSYITPAVELLKLHRDEKLSDFDLESALDQLKGQDVRRDLQQYFFRPASLRKVAASFDGGGRYNTYYFSAGYDENLGTERDSQNKRISLNARNNYRLWADRLQFDVGVLFSKRMADTRRLPGNDYNVLYDRLADNDGQPLSIGGGTRFRQSYIDTAGQGLLQDWNYRPLQELGMNTFRNDDLSYQLNTGVQIRPVAWANFSAQYRYSSGIGRLHSEWDQQSFQMRNLYNQFSRINNELGTVSSAIPRGGQLNTARNILEQHNARLQFNGDKTWGMHQLAIVAGAELNSLETLREVDAARLGYQPSTETFTPIDLNARYPQYHLAAAGNLLVSPIQPTRETSTERNVLLFGNASYTYDSRYTATFSLRKDEANIFGVEANRRGRPFWSTGLLWNLHEEHFFQIPSIQRLGLRGTHGVMGNVSTASAYLTASLASAPYTFTNRIYQSINTPPNPLLSWEKVRMTNIAVDLSVLRGNLIASVERYFRTSSDLLSQNPVNPSSGVSSLYGNWSSMKSSGWDVSLTSQQLRGRLRWSTNLIVSHVKEVVTDYVQKPSNDNMYLTGNLGQYPIEGKPLYGIYSFRYAGLNEQGDPLGYIDGETSTDYTNIYNGTALSDYRYHGRATPSTFGSLRNTFGYKDIELSFNVSYQLGYYFRESAFSSSQLYNVLGYTSAAFQHRYADRWQEAGDELHTRIPAARYPLNANRDAFYGMAEDHVHRGDQVRLRDVRLAYTLPALGRTGIKGVTAYLYVDNVTLLWAKNSAGFDPEAIPNVGFIHPSPRTYALGLHLKF